MKNCKIKRVLVPYAYVGDFEDIELDALIDFVNKQNSTHQVQSEHVSSSDGYVLLYDKSIKYIDNHTFTFILNHNDYIKLNPQRFLKHYLKK